MVLIFALSMIAYVINGIAGLAEYSDMLAQQKKIITSADVAYFPEFSIESVGSQIGMANNIASTVAYILTWIGTVKMLYPYIKKLGKIKFWTIMGVAMVYYLIDISAFCLGIFYSIRKCRCNDEYSYFFNGWTSIRNHIWCSILVCS